MPSGEEELPILEVQRYLVLVGVPLYNAAVQLWDALAVKQRQYENENIAWARAREQQDALRSELAAAKEQAERMREALGVLTKEAASVCSRLPHPWHTGALREAIHQATAALAAATNTTKGTEDEPHTTGPRTTATSTGEQHERSNDGGADSHRDQPGQRRPLDSQAGDSVDGSRAQQEPKEEPGPQSRGDEARGSLDVAERSATDGVSAILDRILTELEDAREALLDPVILGKCDWLAELIEFGRAAATKSTKGTEDEPDRNSDRDSDSGRADAAGLASANEPAPVTPSEEAGEPKQSELVGTEILTFPEGPDLWVACWIRRDIVSQGRTEKEAVRSLLDAIALTWIWQEEYRARNVNVADTPATPLDVISGRRARHVAAHTGRPAQPAAKAPVCPAVTHAHAPPGSLLDQWHLERCPDPRMHNVAGDAEKAPGESEPCCVTPVEVVGREELARRYPVGEDDEPPAKERGKLTICDYGDECPGHASPDDRPCGYDPSDYHESRTTKERGEAGEEAKPASLPVLEPPAQAPWERNATPGEKLIIALGWDFEDFLTEIAAAGDEAIAEAERILGTPSDNREKAGASALLRERLGRDVRLEWIAWAKTQPDPKPSWLVPWSGMSEPDREVDRRIGERIYAIGAKATIAAQQAELERVKAQLSHETSMLRNEEEAHMAAIEGWIADCGQFKERAEKAEAELAKLRAKVERVEKLPAKWRAEADGEVSKTSGLELRMCAQELTDATGTS